MNKFCFFVGTRIPPHDDRCDDSGVDVFDSVESDADLKTSLGNHYRALRGKLGILHSADRTADVHDR